MNTTYNKETIEELLERISVSKTAYDKAEARYKDLTAWFERKESQCSQYSPHIYPQGSFRLGTAIKPVGEDGELDIDVGCRLLAGISKQNYTPKDLKDLVGRDLEEYRKASGIKAPMEAKHRCWCLHYADDVNFHIDAVPSIPEDEGRRGMIKEAMARKTDEQIASLVSELAGAITDDRDANYEHISDNWRISNSEGFALWFESRAKKSQFLMEKLASAEVDPLPPREWDSPLQNVVKILKYHRDVMFKEKPDCKPISVIITTLAARAYEGEQDVAVALRDALSRMGDIVGKTTPKVPNPVNPEEEDFADKWSLPEYKNLRLEQNFWDWLKKAQEDLVALATTEDPVVFEKTASASFGFSLPKRQSAIQKKGALLEKAAQLKVGAKTSSAGIIGSMGATNLPHKFYGDEEIHPE